MIKPGKIVIGIDKKVYFEPIGLPKPDKDTWEGGQFCYYETAMEYYEASKQLIEVSNQVAKMPLSNGWVIYVRNILNSVTDNQPCKAEIAENKAIIVGLI